MSITQLIDKIKSQPDTVTFHEVIDTIAAHYDYTPARFTNGDAVSEAGTNEGSCKIFAFAQLNGLNEAETLACFGDFYRKDVLENPDGTDHANIRNFMVHGWAGIKFDQPALATK